MGPRAEERITPQNSIAQDVDNADNQNNNATASEEGLETTETADAWAVAEGYTPLSDFNSDAGINGRNPYVMVSTGPSQYSDSDGDEDDGGSDWQQGTEVRGAFYVNPAVFGNISGADASPAVSNTLEEFNFDEIAGSALSALDEEYQQTVVRSHAVSLNEKQDDEDIKIIAAAFDKRSEESQQSQQEGDFITHWEDPGLKLKSEQEQQRDRKKDDDVDTDAVRRAVETLSVKNKDAPFQRKFAIWQQNQSQPNHPHKLIPTTSYKAFHESNPTAESRLASAHLSRSATLAEAVVRLSLLSSFQGDLILIDIVGVDQVECESVLTIQNTFQPFVMWPDDYVLSSQWDRKIRVHFRLIGRELFTTTTTNGLVIDLLDSSSRQSPSLLATATCHSGVYHEFLEETCREGSDLDILGGRTIPDLAVAFNAGIWGYREWADTIQHLARQQHYTTSRLAIDGGDESCSHRGLPMVVTAYTLDECQEDQEVISQSIASMGDARAEILWESERNPFGSQVIRETKGSTQDYRENAYWQAWSLGGTTSFPS